MAADCKSAGVAYGGSNPSLPTIKLILPEKEGFEARERRDQVGAQICRIANLVNGGGPAQRTTRGCERSRQILPCPTGFMAGLPTIFIRKK